MDYDLEFEYVGRVPTLWFAICGFGMVWTFPKPTEKERRQEFNITKTIEGVKDIFCVGNGRTVGIDCGGES